MGKISQALNKETQFPELYKKYLIWQSDFTSDWVVGSDDHLNNHLLCSCCSFFFHFSTSHVNFKMSPFYYIKDT